MGAWGLGSDENDDTLDFLTVEFGLETDADETDLAKRYDVDAFYTFLEENDLSYDYLSDVGMVVYAVKNKAVFKQIPDKALKVAAELLQQELAELTSQPVDTTRTWEASDYPERIETIKAELALVRGYCTDIYYSLKKQLQDIVSSFTNTVVDKIEKDYDILSLYYFGLYCGNQDFEYLVDSFGSLEGLDSMVDRYKNQHGYTETKQQLKKMLKWSFADSPFHCAISDKYNLSNGEEMDRITTDFYSIYCHDLSDLEWEKSNHLYSNLMLEVSTQALFSVKPRFSPDCILLLCGGDVDEQLIFKSVKAVNGESGLKQFILDWR